VCVCVCVCVQNFIRIRCVRLWANCSGFSSPNQFPFAKRHSAGAAMWRRSTHECYQLCVLYNLHVVWPTGAFDQIKPQRLIDHFPRKHAFITRAKGLISLITSDQVLTPIKCSRNCSETGQFIEDQCLIRHFAWKLSSCLVFMRSSLQVIKDLLFQSVWKPDDENV